MVPATAEFIGEVSKGSDSYEKTSVIRGHHIYKSVWTPFIRKELMVEVEDGNEHSEHAVAMITISCFFGGIGSSLQVTTMWVQAQPACDVVVQDRNVHADVYPILYR